MAFVQLMITGYQIGFNNSLTTVGTITRNRFINLQPQPDASKIDEIVLVFTTESPVGTVVANVIKQTDSTVFLSILLPVPEFAMYYDLVRSEKPLILQIEYDGVLKTNVPVPAKRFFLGTHSFVFEPVGEGPADTSK